MDGDQVQDSGSTPDADDDLAVRQNIAVLAHIDAGKTTVTEQLLYLSGAVRYAGSVEDGTTVTDWQEAEQRRGITIGSATVTFSWDGREVTVVDTPGHVDFTVEVERSLRVIEGGVVVISAPDGVQAQTETVWHQAAKHALPVIGFVNKLDRDGWEMSELQQDIRERLAIEPLPLQLPAADAPQGGLAVIDILAGERRVWDEIARKQPARRPRIETLSAEEEVERQVGLERLMDHLALVDDDFADAALGDEPLTQTDYLHALSRATARRHCLPLVLGSARGGAGVIGLADTIAALLPPTSRAVPQPTFLVPSGVVGAPVGADSPELLALVFKTERRQNGSRIAYVRIFAGEMLVGSCLERLPAQHPFVPQQLVQVFGADEEPCASLSAGMIGGIVTTRDIAAPTTGETLGQPGGRFALEPIGAPTPVISVTLGPDDLEVDAELRGLLQEEACDDPSLALGIDPISGLVVLSGMGELHLEIVIERLRVSLGDRFRAGKLRPDRRSLLSHPGAGFGRAEGSPESGHPTWVEVSLQIAPHTSSGHIITQASGVQGQRGPLEAGVARALADGAGTELPIAPSHVTIVEVRTSSQEPFPVQYLEAASRATEDAVRNAGFRPAEPWMALRIVVPDKHVGSVVSDLARRKGRVNASQTRGELQVLNAEAPLALLIGYSTGLRSLTGGRATFTMSPKDYRSEG